MNNNVILELCTIEWMTKRINLRRFTFANMACCHLVLCSSVLKKNLYANVWICSPKFAIEIHPSNPQVKTTMCGACKAMHTNACILEEVNKKQNYIVSKFDSETLFFHLYKSKWSLGKGLLHTVHIVLVRETLVFRCWWKALSNPVQWQQLLASHKILQTDGGGTGLCTCAFNPGPQLNHR